MRLSICLSVYLLFYSCICLSMCLFICLSLPLSPFIYVCHVTIYLSSLLTIYVYSYSISSVSQSFTTITIVTIIYPFSQHPVKSPFLSRQFSDPKKNAALLAMDEVRGAINGIHHPSWGVRQLLEAWKLPPKIPKLR